jgi:beta-lactamase superfamily II metal-dependent hydrolase
VPDTDGEAKSSHAREGIRRQATELLERLRDVNNELHGVANDLCLVFSRDDKLLFLGDLEARQLRSVVTCLRKRHNTRFEVMIAAHHGTHWHDKLRYLSARVVLVSNGERMRPYYKNQYEDIGCSVLQTETTGDLKVCF